MKLIDLEKVLKICDAAAPGPWKNSGSNLENIWDAKEEFVAEINGAFYSGVTSREANIEFILCARSVMREITRRLIDHLKEADNG